MLKNFYCLYDSTSTSLNLEERVSSLKFSCQKQGVRFFGLDQQNLELGLPVLGEKDGIFNIAKGSYLLETQLLNEKVKSIYRTYNHLNQNDDSNILTFELIKKGFNLPKTIFLPSTSTKLQLEQIKSLGGFPIILKTFGNSSGVGVMKVDSWASFRSLKDYLFSINEKFMMREFIDVDYSDRVAVLGDRVLYVLRRPNKEGDFRSDGFHKEVKEVELSGELNDYFVKAAHACNFNFAGLDIIYNRFGKPYILEVNAPFNFAANEKKLGRSISMELIRWMKENH